MTNDEMITKLVTITELLRDTVQAQQRSIKGLHSLIEINKMRIDLLKEQVEKRLDDIEGTFAAEDQELARQVTDD